MLQECFRKNVIREGKTGGAGREFVAVKYYQNLLTSSDAVCVCVCVGGGGGDLELGTSKVQEAGGAEACFHLQLQRHLQQRARPAHRQRHHRASPTLFIPPFPTCNTPRDHAPSTKGWEFCISFGRRSLAVLLACGVHFLRCLLVLRAGDGAVCLPGIGCRAHSRGSVEEMKRHKAHYASRCQVLLTFFKRCLCRLCLILAVCQ